MTDGPRYARVIPEVEPFHLDHLFDYAIPEDTPVSVGSRVQVTFGGRRVRGVVAELSSHTDLDRRAVRPLGRVLGPHAWMRPEDLEIARWAGARFCAPVADVVRHALPDRVIDVERRAAEAGWFPPRLAPRPSAESVPATSGDGWEPYGERGRALLTAAATGAGSWYWRPLPTEDVPVRIAELVLAALGAGRDVLVVVPDPKAAVGDAVVSAAAGLAVDVRGQPGQRATYRAWLAARCGVARVVVGERGVAFWPLRELGLAVCVDEASPALKERRSPRHHAREVVLERARRDGAAGVLVGRVPSAEGWRLLSTGRLRTVTGRRADERAAAPLVRVATADGRVRTRLLPEATAALRRATARGAYGVVLTSRRGEGRLLVCTDCGERLTCARCGAGLDPGEGGGVECPRCGERDSGRPECRACGGRRFAPLAAGTRRLAAELRQAVDVEVAALEGYAADAPPPPAVLVMTRGSVLSRAPGRVDAVVLGDIDSQLARPALDAAEDTLRLAMQVASWTVQGRPGAGRGTAAGDAERDAIVVAQTRTPEHHAVQALVRWDPGGFWRDEARIRGELSFPPATHAVRIRVPERGEELAGELRTRLPSGARVRGPAPVDAGSQLLLTCTDRVASLAALSEVRREWSADGTDLWVDVDPVDVT